MNTLILHPQTSLDLEQLILSFQGKLLISLSEESRLAILKSRHVIDSSLQEQRIIYGINTGFGKLAQKKIEPHQLEELQRNLLYSHAAGVGDPLPDEVIRLVLLLKIHSLALGYSGISLEIIEFLITIFNNGFYPQIPEKGSVGASGDLAPLAHLGLALLGEGHFKKEQKIYSAAQVLKILKLQAIHLNPKDGLALINGTQVSTALALANLFRIEKLFQRALESGAMTTLASGGSAAPFEACIHRIRQQKGQNIVAEKYRELFQGTLPPQGLRIQDPYCIRCQPQVMGACYDLINFVKETLLREANSVTDNPLIFVETNSILSGGNFHAQPVAFAADILALACAEIGSLSERRIAFLMDEHFSHLPTFLTDRPGLYSGLMLAQVTAASLVSENKALAHPASIDSIPTSANQEDHVSMATYAARRLGEMTHNAEYIISIELLSACQALDLSEVKTFPHYLQSIYLEIRQNSPFYKDDTPLHQSIENVWQWVFNNI